MPERPMVTDSEAELLAEALRRAAHRVAAGSRLLQEAVAREDWLLAVVAAMDLRAGGMPTLTLVSNYVDVVVGVPAPSEEGLKEQIQRYERMLDESGVDRITDLHEEILAFGRRTMSL